MSESFLYVQDILPVFEEMSSRTVSESMNGDGGVEAGLDQRILKNPPYISLIDTLRRDTPSMSLEDKVVLGYFFLNVLSTMRSCSEMGTYRSFNPFP